MTMPYVPCPLANSIFCRRGKIVIGLDHIIPTIAANRIDLIGVAGIDGTRNLNSPAIRVELQIAAIQADGHVAVEIHRAAIRVDGAVVRRTTVAKVCTNRTLRWISLTIHR